MSEEDFKKSIVFQERDDYTGLVRKIRAGVVLSFEVAVSKDLINFKDACSRAREVATESLFRMVYQDRRSEFYDAIYGLHYSAPNEISFHEKIDRILALAKRQ